VHILQLVPTLSVGGAERIVALLARELQTLGHRVSVVALGRPTGSWIEAELAGHGISTTFLGKGAGFEAATVGRLAARLRSLRPDVVHTHLHVLKYLLPAQVAWRRAAIVHTLHNLAKQEATEADQRLQRTVFGRRVAAVAIGDAVAESVVARYGRPARATIPNGIDVAAQQVPDGTRSTLRATLGLGPTTPTFAVVGRLNPQKNHALLLEAFADPRLAHAHLLVVGDGELRAELETRAAPLGDRIHFLGIRADVPALLSAADAFVLASSWEGNPLVVMEALAAGRPVVATRVGCVPELVDDACGRLVDAGDAPALADALTELAGSASLRAELGAQAQSRAQARYDAPVMARAYADLFEEIIHPSQPELRSPGGKR